MLHKRLRENFKLFGFSKALFLRIQGHIRNTVTFKKSAGSEFSLDRILAKVPLFIAHLA
jgi:hypothetical protein